MTWNEFYKIIKKKRKVGKFADEIIKILMEEAGTQNMEDEISKEAEFWIEK